MNKTFKVTFNKARGALMVVNEITKSVQKKSTVTIIAAGAAALVAGGASAEDIISTDGSFYTVGSETVEITNVTNVEGSKAAGFALQTTGSTSDVDELEKLSVIVDAEKAPDLERAYGLALEHGKNLTIKGDFSADVKSVENTQSRALRNNGGGVLTIEGNTSIKTVAGGSALAVGVDVWDGGSALFKGDASVDVKVNDNDVYGVQACRNAQRVEFSGDNTVITVRTSAPQQIDPIEGPKPDGYNQTAEGVYTSGTKDSGGIFFSGKNLTVNSSNDVEDTALSTATALRSESYGRIEIGDETTTVLNVTSHKGTALGIWTSNYTKAIFGGKSLTINAKSDSGDAVGYECKWSSDVTFSVEKMVVNATSQTGSAIGLSFSNHIQSLPVAIYPAGQATFGHELTINAVGGSAVGVEVLGGLADQHPDNDYGAGATFKEDLSLSVSSTATGRSAIGIVADAMPLYGTYQTNQKSAQVAVLGNLNAVVSAVNATDAYGLYATDGGRITVDGNASIDAAGGFAVFAETSEDLSVKSCIELKGKVNTLTGRVVVDNSSLTINGSTTINWADTETAALTAVNGATVTLSGSAIVPSIAVEAGSSLVIKGGSTLQTGVGQIFTNDDAGKTDATLASTSVLFKDGITFTTGTLALTDKGSYTSSLLTSMQNLVTDPDNVHFIFMNADLLVDGADENGDVSVSNATINGPVTVESEDAKSISLKDTNVIIPSSVAASASEPVVIGSGLPLKLEGDNTFTAESEKPLATTSGAIELTGPGTQSYSNIAMSAPSFTGTPGGVMEIGSERGAAQHEYAEFKLNGSTFFLDPVWQDGMMISDASFLAAVDVQDLTGKIIVGENSVAALGAAKAAAVQGFEKLGLIWGQEVGSALYIGAPIDASAAAIVVDNDITATAFAADPGMGTIGTVSIAANSILMIDQTAVGAETAIQGAELQLDDARIGLINATNTTVTLADTVTGTVSEVLTDNPFIEATFNASEGTVTGTVSAENGLGALASTGIQAMARRADFVLAQTIADRTAVDQELGTGLNLWADVTGERYEADSLANGGNFTADTGYGAFGADFAVTQDIALGGAIQYGTGSVRSSVANIKNEIDSYGITAYGSMKFGDAKVVGELAYIKSENDITSSQTALNGQVDADIYSLGVTAQYKFNAGNFSFVPSIGLRVSRLETDAMTIGAVNVDKQKQTLVQVPLALRITGAEMNASGWNLAPSFKIAYVPTFGDKEIEVLGFEQDVIDTSPVQGEFGLRAQNGNLMLNANLMVGGGKDGTSALGGKIGIKYLF